MKAYIFQPQYSNDLSLSDKLFEDKIKLLEDCKEDADIIVLPEYSDIPCVTSTEEETLFYHNRYMERLMEKCVETAQRCKSLVAFNALENVDGKYRNTTFVIDKNGEIIGKYYKMHIPPGEKRKNVDDEYTEEFSEPYIIEADGVRYGFLTCYDFYFYESFSKIAKAGVDVIIGCSHQRSDTHSAIETSCRFIAYNTNAYVLRSSISFDEGAKVCGASMIVSPEGEVLLNMKGKFGVGTAEFDPHKKYLKPAGFGRADAPHYMYIEEGRTPWNYRQCGSAICLADNQMPYPRVCAYHGFSKVAPENSMAAFGAAVALGAEEIGFDLWLTKDKELVSLHDFNLGNISDGHGNVWDYSYEELEKFDFGAKSGDEFRGLKILRLEDILKKLACHTIMNIHIRFDDAECIERAVRLIKKYDCEKHIYFTSANDEVLKFVKEKYPEINLCVRCNEESPSETVDRAIAIGAKKAEIGKVYLNREIVVSAHANGIACNAFLVNNQEEIEEYIKMGTDTILTENYFKIAQTAEKFKNSLQAEVYLLKNT